MANHHAGEVLVHLGSSNYLERYKIYVTHLQEWQQQFDKLESVDLRYDRQIIVNPDLQGPMKQPPLSTEAAKKAMITDVILPEETRPQLCRALSMLRNKRQDVPQRKHGNIPL